MLLCPGFACKHVSSVQVLSRSLTVCKYITLTRGRRLFFELTISCLCLSSRAFVGSFMPSLFRWSQGGKEEWWGYLDNWIRLRHWDCCFTVPTGPQQQSLWVMISWSAMQHITWHVEGDINCCIRNTFIVGNFLETAMLIFLAAGVLFCLRQLLNSMALCWIFISGDQTCYFPVLGRISGASSRPRLLTTYVIEDVISVKETQN